jgi:uncharacterized protein
MSTSKPVTLITGASAGIGEALARVFAEHGHELVLAARREAQLGAVADAIVAGGGRRPQVLPIDLARPDACDRVADELTVRGLDPAIVVNCAGFGLCGHATDLDRTQQLAMIDLNVRVLTDLSLRWIDAMARHGGGVINVGSVASFLPGPGMAVYHASKAYVLAFTEALHQELKPKGIKVTVVCPGPVPTEFQARAGIAANRLPRRLTRSAERVARETYEGFMKGQRLVIPGFANKVAAALPRFFPRSRVLALIEDFQAGSGMPQILLK